MMKNNAKHAILLTLVFQSLLTTENATHEKEIERLLFWTILIWFLNSFSEQVSFILVSLVLFFCVFRVEFLLRLFCSRLFVVLVEKIPQDQYLSVCFLFDRTMLLI